MIDENSLERYAEIFYKRYNAINTHYLQLIGEQLRALGTLSPTSLHRLEQMKAMGANVDIIRGELAYATARANAEIEQIFAAAAKENYAFSEKFYSANGVKQLPFSTNIPLQKLIKAQVKITAGSFTNLANSTAKSLTYKSLLGRAITAASSGLTDYSAAIRQAVRQTAAKGISLIEFESGHKRRLDTSVRQNILWGIKETNQQVSDLTGEQFGADGFEISLHSSSRPGHAPMQGKQYAIGKARRVRGVNYPSFSEVEGLLQDYGCRHFKFPILLGISAPAHTDEQIQAQQEHDSELIKIGDTEKTRYDWSQDQRRLETAVRRQKDIAMIAKASGDDALRREAQSNISDLTRKYDKLSSAAGLPSKRERMTVSGFRAVKVEARKPLTAGGGGGIISKQGFASGKLLNQHLEKHLKEYTGFTADDYVNRAAELLNSPVANGVRGFVGNNGKTYRYDTSNNDFAVRNKSGAIATLYKPQKGIEYWERQVEKYDKT